MKILIKQSIKGIGKAGEVKDFPQGYAQNFIIKKGYGVIATNEVINKNLKEKDRINQEQKRVEDDLVKAILSLKDKTIEIKSQSNEYGVLFSSIHKKDILLEIKKLVNAPITNDMLSVDEPIKSTGQYRVVIKYKIYDAFINLKVI